ncbi:universal stress protein [Mycobacterium sp. Y57]|uniref:universal stress protein n=1 Tax=Mycolicibacterium xanthum TaxID=2796469 RepID=UPI001C84DD13|nr:universal stress protein [Mycolicibacterium xanthum]MBX7432161.1 universal stress protein [Mycolicibacterium xanthum]
MTSHRGIVVGIDGSPEAELAVEWAAREAVLHEVPLTLAYIRPDARARTWYEVSVSDDLEQAAEQHGREILQQATMAAEQAAANVGPLTVGEHVAEGNPVASMVDLSKDAQLLVVGSRGLGRVGRALLGSVSAGLVHHAHCPVAVIHPQADPEMQSEQAPVVVGIDGSSASETAVAIAFDEASRRGVGLVAVHAWSDPTVYAFPNEEWMTFRPRAEELLAERLAGWQERYPDVEVQRVVVRDRPAHQLLEQAESAQLVVVGSHGRGGFAGMLVGSVGAAVAQSARTPVIVARSS